MNIKFSKDIEALARKITEGYLSPSIVMESDGLNIYHRPVNIHESKDISYIIGLVSNGLRGSAQIQSQHVLANLQALNYCSRMHLPLVINIMHQGSSREYLIQLKQLGFFILIAKTPSEEINLTLLAHKIAESAMVPGAVISTYTNLDNELNIPNEKLIKEFLGNSDDQINCPTPSQSIIFGKHRRRVPNWFNLDVPVMIGVRKGDQEDAFEKAATQKYFFDHLPELIDHAIIDFNNTFGTTVTPVTKHPNSGSHIVVTIDQEAIDLFNKCESELKDSQLVTPVLVSPFPYQRLRELLKDKRSVTVLEGVSTTAKNSSLLYSEVRRSLTDINLYRGLFSSGLTLQTFISAMKGISKGEIQDVSYLGFDFTRKSSEYPTHEALLQEIDVKYPNLVNESINETILEAGKNELHEEIPLSLRHYADKGPIYSRLSRFYNNTAVFYDRDDKNELIADPFNALPVIPPATAEMFSFSRERKFIPEIDIKNCTGQGEGILLCPHSALLPVVVSIEELIKTGVNIASNKGITFAQLPPMIKNLAKVAHGVIKKIEIEIVRDFLAESFNKLANQMQILDDKKEAAISEINNILSEIGDFPVAKTDIFYNNPNAAEPGSGELFSVIVNPRTCTGCAVCSHVDDAIAMVPQTDVSLERAIQYYNVWQHLPVTSAKTISRLLHNKSYDSLTALTLGRNYHFSMTGGNKLDNYDAQKTILRLLTTTIESVNQARVLKHTDKLNDLVNNLSEQVHEELSALLPKENIESLANSLRKAEGKRVSLHDVVDQIPSSEQKSIDSIHLKRRAKLIDELKRLLNVYLDGPTGQGRARYSMIISGQSMLNWAGQFPVNHFTVPVVADWGDTATDHVLGLIQGQVRYIIDNIKLLRRAELEINNTYDPDSHDIGIAGLQWSDLSEEEKNIIPPILLVAEWRDLNSTGWGNLSSLLSTDFPVKVVIFESLTSGKQSAEASYKQISAGILSTIALKRPFVFQGGIADTTHLFNGFRDAFERSGTALLSLYHTDFSNHGIANTDWQPYAHLALDSRAFPLVSYDPGHGDGIYGNISIDGNRNLKDDWYGEQLSVKEQEIAYKITWADWAFTQPEWRNEFQETEAIDSNEQVANYIRLDENSRKQKIPVIIREATDSLVYYSVSDRIIKMTRTILANWHTLQELSGVKAEIPEKLKRELNYEFEKEKAKEIEELKKQYEKQLSDLEANQSEEVRQQLKDKLVSLAKMARKTEN